MALTAFFGLCVPGVSNGIIKQTYPADSLVPLTAAERTEYVRAIEGEDATFRIKSDKYLVLLTTKAGHCHVVTTDGDPKFAEEAFLEALRAAGGSEDNLDQSEQPGLTVTGIIWTKPSHDGVAVGFSAQKSGDTGFYAWAFGIHKD